LDVEPILTFAREDPEALIVLVGPTASGKTAAAVEVAEALGGEIVSCDSVQVYRGFDIGSGKPTAEESARARHHLVDILDPLEAIDAARFVELADLAIAELRARGKRPILCGGTFLWVRALLHGLAEGPPADAEVRARHHELVEREGRTALHARLAEVDPEAATRLHPNDAVRVSRALEVYELTGRRQSEGHADHRFAIERHRARLFGVERSSEELTERITARVDAWLAAGWVDEVARLTASGYGAARAMGSVGYRQVALHLAGEVPESDLGPSIVRATRVFARRQRTWLNHQPVTYLAASR
jgi:tRNA dimethylallyltransferase